MVEDSYGLRKSYRIRAWRNFSKNQGHVWIFGKFPHPRSKMHSCRCAVRDASFRSDNCLGVVVFWEGEAPAEPDRART